MLHLLVQKRRKLTSYMVKFHLKLTEQASKMGWGTARPKLEMQRAKTYSSWTAWPRE